MAAAVVAMVASPSPASRRLPSRASTSSSAAPSLLLPRLLRRSARRLRLVSAAAAAGDEADVLPGLGGDGEATVPGRLEELGAGLLGGSQLDIGGLAFQGDMGSGFAGGGGAGGAGSSGGGDGNKTLDRGINTAIVLAASTYALTKLLTVDQDYWHVSLSWLPPSSTYLLLSSPLRRFLWVVFVDLIWLQGWTIFEILRYMPAHNWSAYEGALKANPVLAKMMISGIVYSLGDWIAQVIPQFHVHAIFTNCYCHRARPNSPLPVAGSACSAMKASPSLNSTELGCSGLALLGSHFTARFHIITTIYVR
jgi:protein Mpv17